MTSAAALQFSSEMTLMCITLPIDELLQSNKIDPLLLVNVTNSATIWHYSENCHPRKS